VLPAGEDVLSAWSWAKGSIAPQRKMARTARAKSRDAFPGEERRGEEGIGLVRQRGREVQFGVENSVSGLA
jgi:hypothetical protein